jgi:hypothetical protein
VKLQDYEDTIDNLIRETYPQIDWKKFDEINRSLNWELWHGPLPSDYWTVAEPLEHYEWKGYRQAENDIREILEPLPGEMWFDLDGQSVITDSDPDNYDPYWSFTCEHCGMIIFQEEPNGKYLSYEGGDCEHSPDYKVEAIWTGGDWMSFNPAKVLCHEEVYSQAF